MVTVIRIKLISVCRCRSNVSAAVASCLKRKLLLIRNILCVVLVHDVFELRYQAVRITGFRSVMYGDKFYTETWKNYANVLTNLNCISAKTGQIFYDKRPTRLC